MSEANSKKELTGHHVFWMLVAFFGVMFVVNIIFAVAAVKSFTGEDVPKSYRQGIEYNQAISARRDQLSLGWTVAANNYVQENGSRVIVVDARDKTGNRLEGLEISGIIRHPTDKAFDLPVDLKQDPVDQLYRTSVDLSEGHWTLIVTARSGEKAAYKFTHDIWVR